MLWLMNALKSEMFVQSYDGRNLIKLGNQKVCEVANGLPLCRFVTKTRCKSHEAKCRRFQIIF